MLMRVPVMNGEAISPDLEIPDNRLYEWTPNEKDEAPVSRQMKHEQSHASLLRDVSAASPPPTRSRLDAIVVPAARRIAAAFHLAVCRAVCTAGPALQPAGQGRARSPSASRRPSARVLSIVEVPEGYHLPRTTLTSDPRVPQAE